MSYSAEDQRADRAFLVGAVYGKEQGRLTVAKELKQILDDTDHQMPPNVADRLWDLVEKKP